MIHEIKSGEQVMATITQRQVVAFRLNIPGTDDMESLDVPIWANTVAIDADGAIWAYESITKDVRIPGYSPNAWVDCGPAQSKAQQIGETAGFPDWAKSKVDLRNLK